eukprot:g9878.t1
MAHFELIRDPALRWAVEETQKEIDRLERHLTKYKNGDPHQEIDIHSSFYKVEDRISLIPHSHITNIYKQRLKTYKSDFEAHKTNRGK